VSDGFCLAAQIDNSELHAVGSPSYFCNTWLAWPRPLYGSLHVRMFVHQYVDCVNTNATWNIFVNNTLGLPCSGRKCAVKIKKYALGYRQAIASIPHHVYSASAPASSDVVRLL